MKVGRVIGGEGDPRGSKLIKIQNEQKKFIKKIIKNWWAFLSVVCIK